MGKAPEHVLVGKARMRLSTLDPLDTHTWHTLTITALAAQDSGQGQGVQGTAGAAGASATAGGGRVAGAGAGAGAGGSAATEVGLQLQQQQQQQRVVLSGRVRLVYPCLETSAVTGGLSLLKAYLTAPLPDPCYYLEVRGEVTWEAPLVVKYVADVHGRCAWESMQASTSLSMYIPSHSNQGCYGMSLLQFPALRDRYTADG